MKHFSQTIIHNKLFVEEDWGRNITIYLGDLQKRLCCMKKNVAGTAVSVRNFGKKSPDLGQGFDPEVIPNQQRRLILKTMHLYESMAILTKNKRYRKNL